MGEGRTFSLPKAFNVMLDEDAAPPYEEIVKRRRLGRTELTAAPGQAGPLNAKPENPGIFDYAHLRAPLPRNLDSELFPLKEGLKPVESYFLMRRSTDGYVSATGMFKASFPWATPSQEEKERKYIKSLVTTSIEETAGNVWIPPFHALELAEEYHITTWIRALLDNAPIDKGPDSDKRKGIVPPPPYHPSEDTIALATPPTPSRGGNRSNRYRSSSPSKIAAPAASRKFATPRKPRASKNAGVATNGEAASTKDTATTSTQETLSSSEDAETVKVTVDSNTIVNGNTETTHTEVKVEMPAHSSALPLPETTEEMIATAKEMVEEARKIDGMTNGTSKKRRAAEVLDLVEEEGEEPESGIEQPRNKRAKVLEEELRIEKVKTKALIGLTATLAIGFVLPILSLNFA
ncbi:MAG: hypothetical protein M1829_004870 [Trizodia sp. TS-e1964]|nr:MAG: hypothetical protein M1829_004870 [Trizodia sp. TS-e1964]